MQTWCPSLAKNTAIFVASVLLPHPPFAFRTITWRISIQVCCCNLGKTSALHEPRAPWEPVRPTRHTRNTQTGSKLATSRCIGYALVHADRVFEDAGTG